MILLIGFLFMVFIYVGVISMLVGIFPAAVFLNLSSLLLLIVTLTFYLIVSKSGSIIGRYFKSSFKKEYNYSKIELENLGTAIKNIIKFNIAVGIAAFVIFIIAALYFLDSPEHFGPNLANCLISVVYAITVSYFIFFPVQAWAENKINELNGN